LIVGPTRYQQCHRANLYNVYEVNQEDSEQTEVDGMEKGADSTGNVSFGSINTTIWSRDVVHECV